MLRWLVSMFLVSALWGSLSLPTASAQRLRRASDAARGRGGSQDTRRAGPRRGTRSRWDDQVSVQQAASAVASIAARGCDEPRCETAVVLAIEGTRLGASVGRTAASVRLEFPRIFELQFDESVLFEGTAYGTNAIALGRLGAGARVIDLPELDAGIALSARHWLDSEGSLVGVGGALFADVHPFDLLVVGVRVGFAFFEASWLAELDARIGVQIDRVEIVVGFYLLAISRGTLDGAPLVFAGPSGGIRCRL